MRHSVEVMQRVLIRGRVVLALGALLGVLLGLSSAGAVVPRRPRQPSDAPRILGAIGRIAFRLSAQMSRAAAFTFYEFFAGGGMARLGLGDALGVPVRQRLRSAEGGGLSRQLRRRPLREGDVWDLHPHDLPGRADLAWASSPCQDLSLAGARAGLAGGALVGLLRLLAADGGAGRAGPRAPRHRDRERRRLFNSHGGARLRGGRAGAGRRAATGSARWRSTRRPSCRSRGRRCVIVATLERRDGLAADARRPPAARSATAPTRVCRSSCRRAGLVAAAGAAAPQPRPRRAARAGRGRRLALGRPRPPRCWR